MTTVIHPTERRDYRRMDSCSFAFFHLSGFLFFLTGHKEEESRKSVAGLLRKLSERWESAAAPALGTRSFTRNRQLLGPAKEKDRREAGPTTGELSRIPWDLVLNRLMSGLSQPCRYKKERSDKMGQHQPEINLHFLDITSHRIYILSFFISSLVLSLLFIFGSEIY